MILENFREKHQIWSQYEGERLVTSFRERLKKCACSHEVSMRALVLFFYVCLLFSVRFIETHRIIVIFLCVLAHTEKSCNYSVVFVFFYQFFWTHTLITNFSVSIEKKHTEKFITHWSIRVSSSVPLPQKGAILSLVKVKLT